jgi:hypothetical protein
MGLVGITQPVDPTAFPLLVVYTAMGSAALFAKLGKQKIKIWAFSELVKLIPVSSRWHKVIEFVVFIGFGCAVGMAVADPINIRQALAAGFGWTSIFTGSSSESTTKIK